MSLATHAARFAAPTADRDGRVPLIGLDMAQLQKTLLAAGLEKFRARQVWHWMYHRGVTDFAAMTTLAKPVRAMLAERFSVPRPEVVQDRLSSDGTRKWLFRMVDGQEIETVYIPEEDRGTLCISSQVGCTLTCRFCHTGTQPLVRNLGPVEIIQQVMAARDALGDWPDRRGSAVDRLVTNVVLMGMGEPLYNFESVSAALRIAMDGEGIALSKRRITLSTSGVVPLMARCGEELGVNLAVSLHAVTDDVRDEIMPINRKYPLAELIEACRTYPGVSNARRITFEYVMLDGINDSDADARALVRLINGIPAKINLIPFNPWPGSPYVCSSNTRIDRFSKIVMDAGYASPVRTPRGRDILAACGQLKSESQRQRRAQLITA